MRLNGVRQFRRCGDRVLPGLGRLPLRSAGSAESLESRVCPITRLPMSKASAKPPYPELPPSYEAALEELDQLVARIESGQLPLDQLLAGYQRGAALLAFCRERLEAVEQQVKVLDDGLLKPWEQA